MPMPDRPKHAAWRPALLALLLVGFAAPVQAQTNPVRVADLVNLPIVDESKLVMGRVRAVVRNRDGKIELLLPLGGLLGFGERLVPIPIESVALAGPQVVVVDMPPHRFQKTPTWYGSNSEALAATETISIARQ
jgi:PRC-barrel domain